MKAPFLTIEGQPINKGEIYYVVHSEFGNLTECIASNENNISYGCYFKDKHLAQHYQELVLVRNKINETLKIIETNHKGK